MGLILHRLQTINGGYNLTSIGKKRCQKQFIHFKSMTMSTKRQHHKPSEQLPVLLWKGAKIDTRCSKPTPYFVKKNKLVYNSNPLQFNISNLNKNNLVSLQLKHSNSEHNKNTPSTNTILRMLYSTRIYYNFDNSLAIHTT